MAYDAELAQRVREILAAEKGISEKRMFGGLAFLVDGHLAVSASGQGGLLLRVDPADADRLVTADHVERFVMRGRQMDGWLHVQPGALANDETDETDESDDDTDGEAKLRAWIAHATRYVRSLPPKR
jgi:hypothetical protein